MARRRQSRRRRMPAALARYWAKARRVGKSASRRIRRARAASAPVVRTIVRSVPIMARRKSLRRSFSRRGGGSRWFAILPLATASATATGGFIGTNFALNWLAEKFPTLADPAKPWIRILGKAGTAIGGTWLLRKFASQAVSWGFGIGGLVSAMLDAYVTFTTRPVNGMDGMTGLGSNPRPVVNTAEPTMALPAKSDTAAETERMLALISGRRLTA